MKKSIFQTYAIVICIVAIVAFLISISNFVSSFIDYLDPLNSSRTEISLSSYEYFKMDLLKTTTKEQFYIPNDDEIQNMYESAKNQHLLRINHRIFRSFAVNGLVIILGIILFMTHWKIVKKYESLNQE